MARTKRKKKPEQVTQLDIINSIRKPPVKAGQTFKTIKKQLFRKRKHKGKDND